MKIFISGFTYTTKDEQLKDLFTPFGEVTSAKVINDRETGRSRGFGFVTMTDSLAATKAIDRLNQSVVEGRTLKVTEAVERNDKGGSSSGGYSKNSGGFNSNRW